MVDPEGYSIIVFSLPDVERMDTHFPPKSIVSRYVLGLT